MASVREWLPPMAARFWPAAVQEAARFCPPKCRSVGDITNGIIAQKRNGSYSGVNVKFAPLPFYRETVPGALSLKGWLVCSFPVR